MVWQEVKKYFQDDCIDEDFEVQLYGVYEYVKGLYGKDATIDDVIDALEQVDFFGH